MKQTINFILSANAFFCTIGLLTVSTDAAHFIVCGIVFAASILHFSLFVKYSK